MRVALALTLLPWAALAAPAPQFPNLLAGYPARPAWKVVGVDTHAGLPVGTKLADPASMSLPGVSVDPAAHRVTVTGPSVILAGWDFSLEGGWNVTVEGVNDTITLCNWRVGSNNLVPVQGTATAMGLAITRSNIDGGGLGVTGNPGAIWSLVSYLGTDLTVRHDWLHDAPQHVVEFKQGQLKEKYNLINNLGYAPGAHPNGVQFAGGVAANAEISFNTVYDPQPTGGYPAMDNEDLQVEAQLGATVSNTVLNGNVVIAQGPGAGTTSSYLIAVRQDASPGVNAIDGVTVENEWLDASGAYGPFYPPSGTGLAFIGNMNLVTGTALAAPN